MLIILLASFSSFFLLSCSTKKTVEEVFVTSVYDGDTFKSNNRTFRIFAIDTPEIKDQYNNFSLNKNIELIYAFKSKNKLEELILNKKVKLFHMGKDFYNREIVKVYINNLDIANILVNNGLALVAYIDINNIKNNYEELYYVNILKNQYFAYYNSLGFWSNKENFKQIFPKHSF